KQVSARLQGGVNAPENVLLHVRRKVDQHVAAEYDVELAQDRVAVQQIQGAEFDPAANGRLDSPSARRLHIEITLQALGGQAARNRQAVVFSRLASREHGARQLGSNNLHPRLADARIVSLVLVDGHRQDRK